MKEIAGIIHNIRGKLQIILFSQEEPSIDKCDARKAINEITEMLDEIGRRIRK